MLDINNKTKQFYNDIGVYFSKSRQKTYNNNTSVWNETKPYINKIKNGDAILDLGCGNGRLLTGIKKNKAIDFIGVDFSKTLINEAKKLHPDFTFKKRDITNESFWKSLDKKKFDKIFCIATFHHIENKKKQIRLLKQMEKHLKKNGFIFITIWNSLNRKFWIWHLKNIKLKFRNIRLLKYPFDKKWRYLFTFNKSYVRKIVKKTNLEIIKMFYSDKKGDETGLKNGRNLVIVLSLNNKNN